MSVVAKVGIAILAVLGALVVISLIGGLLHTAFIIAVVGAIGYGVVKVFGSKGKAPAIGDRDLHKKLKQLETDASQFNKPRK